MPENLAWPGGQKPSEVKVRAKMPGARTQTASEAVVKFQCSDTPPK